MDVATLVIFNLTIISIAQIFSESAYSIYIAKHLNACVYFILNKHV